MQLEAAAEAQDASSLILHALARHLRAAHAAARRAQQRSPVAEEAAATLRKELRLLTRGRADLTSASRTLLHPCPITRALLLESLGEAGMTTAELARALLRNLQALPGTIEASDRAKRDGRSAGEAELAEVARAGGVAALSMVLRKLLWACSGGTKGLLSGGCSERTRASGEEPFESGASLATLTEEGDCDADEVDEQCSKKNSRMDDKEWISGLVSSTVPAKLPF